MWTCKHLIANVSSSGQNKIDLHKPQGMTNLLQGDSTVFVTSLEWDLFASHV